MRIGPPGFDPYRMMIDAENNAFRGVAEGSPGFDPVANRHMMFVAAALIGRQRDQEANRNAKQKENLAALKEIYKA